VIQKRERPAAARMRALAMIERLARRGFCAHLDPETGALLITDMTGKRRDLSTRIPIADVFDQLIAGLEVDQTLLTATPVRPLPTVCATRALNRNPRQAVEPPAVDRSLESGVAPARSIAPARQEGEQ
jgi:hypothetical protein